MEASSEAWFASDMGIVDDLEFLNQCQFNSLHEHFGGENLQLSFSSGSQSSYSTCHESLDNNRPVKQLKTSWDFKNTANSSQLLCFGTSNSPPPNVCLSLKPKTEAVSPSSATSLLTDGTHSHETVLTNRVNKRSHSATRSPSHAQDHILAERKRREKLCQRFIALSSILPGLKKMDKASVLSDAIRYVKQLRERVDMLEEQTKKRTVESVVFVKRSQICADDETGSCDESFNGATLPEIEARVAEKDVLIRIQCENQKGIVGKIISQVEKLSLSIVNSCALPFGSSTLDITIIAHMDPDFCITVKELVKKLRMAIVESISATT